MVSSGKFQIEVAEQAVEKKQQTKLQEDKHSLIYCGNSVLGTVFAVSEQTPRPYYHLFSWPYRASWLSVVMFAQVRLLFKGQKPALDD